MTSISSNNPFKSFSLSVPFAELSIFLKIVSKVTFKFSSLSAFFLTLTNNSLGKIKKPFVLIKSSFATIASSSLKLA